MIRAVVFDFDGLILDTETNEFLSFQDVYSHYGQQLTLDRWSACVGTDLSLFDPYAYLKEQIKDKYVEEDVRQRRRTLYENRMRDEKLRPGVVEMLDKLEQMGLQIGLASSSTRSWVTGYLEQYGILSRFSCLCTRDDVEKVKPDPALYRLAVEKLGVRPEEAIAFEDSPNGALAAERAGLHCVIIPNAITETMPFGKHTMRVASMLQLDVEQLVARLQTQN